MCVFNSISNEKPAEKLDNYSIPGNLNFLKLKKMQYSNLEWNALIKNKI